MTRHSLFKSVLLTGFVTLLCASSETAQAQVEKPFKINGSGFAPTGLSIPPEFGGTSAPAPHYIQGNATHLGRHRGAGAEVTLNAVVNQSDGSISGAFESGIPFRFEGANGDVLSCTYGDTNNGAATQGNYKLTPVGSGKYIANFVAEFVPVSDECSGKFAGVTGSWIMYATSKPFILGKAFEYSWHGEGTLTFMKGK
jgi:hypothetical protein